jgi:DNA-directed RNA polymerase subunit K/omega
VPWENDKPTVVALRELAEGKLDHLFKLKDKASRSTPLVASSSDEAD